MEEEEFLLQSSTDTTSADVMALNNEADFLMLIMSVSEDGEFDMVRFLDVISFMELKGFIEPVSEHRWVPTQKGWELIKQLKRGIRLAMEVDIRRPQF